jgi:RimJ/RimL family protein N-acetyltransferase
MAGNSKVAMNTANMPFPYPEGVAEEWISSHATEFFERRQLILGITLRKDKTLLGCIGLTLKLEFENAELGYWIGEEHWNNGFATEAAAALVKYAFDTLGLHKIFAHYFSDNGASGRVLEKIGMVQEGYLQEHVRHWGEYKDLFTMGIIHKPQN